MGLPIAQLKCLYRQRVMLTLKRPVIRLKGGYLSDELLQGRVRRTYSQARTCAAWLVIGERYARQSGKVVRVYIFGAGFEAMIAGVL